LDVIPPASASMPLSGSSRLDDHFGRIVSVIQWEFPESGIEAEAWVMQNILLVPVTVMATATSLDYCPETQ